MPGSAAARALFELWSGKNIVTLAPDPDSELNGFTWACQIVERLIQADHRAMVMFAAPAGEQAQLQLRINGLRASSVRSRLLALAWDTYVRSGLPEDPEVGPVKVGVRAPLTWKKWHETTLLVIDPAVAPYALTDPSAWTEKTRQVLIIANSEATAPRTRGLVPVAVGHQRVSWGDPPLDVILAGTPE